MPHLRFGQQRNSMHHTDGHMLVLQPTVSDNHLQPLGIHTSPVQEYKLRCICSASVLH